MTLVGSARVPVARQSTVRRVARALAYGGGLFTAGSVLAAGVMIGQARHVRRTIPMAEAPPPRCDGVYGAKCPGPPITLVLMGDSSAAGYGVRRTRETPGALLATGISRRLRRPVRLHRLAVVGAISTRLPPQVEAAIDLQPDLAVMLIGANDVTNRTGQTAAVKHLVDAVRALRAAGVQVVVGTCPDLGTLVPIKPPLRWLARRWSRQLAAAQTVAVVEAGGWTVSLGDLLGPRFAAEPHRMFGWDRFHPSAEGYAAVAVALLPTALAALGAAEERRPRLTAGEGVTSLSQAAHEASKVAGTEVRGVRVAGRERGPAGRWALLRHRRAWFGQPRAEDPVALTTPASAVGDATVPAPRGIEPVSGGPVSTHGGADPVPAARGAEPSPGDPVPRSSSGADPGGDGAEPTLGGVPTTDGGP